MLYLMYLTVDKVLYLHVLTAVRVLYLHVSPGRENAVNTRTYMFIMELHVPYLHFSHSDQCDVFTDMYVKVVRVLYVLQTVHASHDSECALFVCFSWCCA